MLLSYPAHITALNISSTCYCMMIIHINLSQKFAFFTRENMFLILSVLKYSNSLTQPLPISVFYYYLNLSDHRQLKYN